MGFLTKSVPCSAAVSVLMPPFLKSVKKVPNFRPLIMFRTAFSAIPLHMTTEIPFSSAQHADRTYANEADTMRCMNKYMATHKFAYFGIHSAESDSRFLAKLNIGSVVRTIRVYETSTFLRRRTRVNSIHI